MSEGAKRSKIPLHHFASLAVPSPAKLGRYKKSVFFLYLPDLFGYRIHTSRLEFGFPF